MIVDRSHSSTARGVARQSVVIPDETLDPHANPNTNPSTNTNPNTNPNLEITSTHYEPLVVRALTTRARGLVVGLSFYHNAGTTRVCRRRFTVSAGACRTRCVA